MKLLLVILLTLIASTAFAYGNCKNQHQPDCGPKKMPVCVDEGSAISDWWICANRPTPTPK